MLYQEDLDAIPCAMCAEPKCDDPKYVHSGCHFDEPLWVVYYGGYLNILCSKCDKVVASIAVAKKHSTGNIGGKS